MPSSLEQVYRTMLESALTGVPVAEAVAEAKISAESIDVSELHQMEQAAFN